MWRTTLAGGVWIASPQLLVGPGGSPAAHQVSILTPSTAAASAGSEVQGLICYHSPIDPESLGGVVLKSVFSPALQVSLMYFIVWITLL